VVLGDAVYERAPVLERALDRALAPVVRLLARLGMTPNAVSWASLVVSLAAAGLIALGHLGAGLVVMAAGQLVDSMDGAMARILDMATPRGRQVDTLVDRLSEAALFAAFGIAGLAPWKWVVLALVAILVLTSVAGRSRLDPGMKRFALYFGLWLPYPLIFKVIFAVNLAGTAIGMLVADCHFQVKMDRLGGDLDTVASRAAALEAAEWAAERPR
jgi:phosphatidylglycerophosphate synthase